VTAVSLELGRSSATTDDNDESAQAGDTAADGAQPPADDATADGPPRRSVLAPFIAAGGADDPPSEQTPGDTGGREDPPRRGDDVSPSEGSATGAAASSATAPRFTPAKPRLTSTGPRIDPVAVARADADADGPLLGDAEELRANWLRLQAGFVDDPREAVSDAADLVEHAAQALVGALRLRQQKLREMWGGGGQKAGSGLAGAGEGGQGAEPSAAADSTEQLRLLIKRYRVLFNQICRS
jgi:hypothetical protein